MIRRRFAFCGAELAAVYVVADQARELHLAELTGNRDVLYGLPAVLAVASHSPAANAFRDGRPLWLTPKELATFIEDDPHHFPTRIRDGDPESPARISLGALPLGHGDQELGCLIVAGEVGDGFSADDRSLLELYADQVAAGLESVAARFAGRRAPQAHLGQSLVPHQGGAFILELSTGHMEAHAHVLELLGLPPEQFDGQVETLLACAVPDDMPALMAVVEPDRLAAVGQQLAFRIRRPNGSCAGWGCAAA